MLIGKIKDNNGIENKAKPKPVIPFNNAAVKMIIMLVAIKINDISNISLLKF